MRSCVWRIIRCGVVAYTVSWCVVPSVYIERCTVRCSRPLSLVYSFYSPTLADLPGEDMADVTTDVTGWEPCSQAEPCSEFVCTCSGGWGMQMVEVVTVALLLLLGCWLHGCVPQQRLMSRDKRDPTTIITVQIDR